MCITMRRSVAVQMFLGIVLTLLTFTSAPARGVSAQDGAVTPVPSISILPQVGEKPVSIETERIDEAGKKLSAKIDKIGKEVSSEAGRWINAGIYNGMTWLKLIVCLALFISVFVGERLLRGWMRSMLRRVRVRHPSFPLPSGSVRALSRPISFLIWTYGSYAALSPLFVHFQQAGGANPLQAALKKAAETGGAVAFVWFAYVLVTTLDEQIKAKAPQGRSFPMSFAVHCRAPLKFFIALVLSRMALPLLAGFPFMFGLLVDLLSILLIISVAWLMIRSTLVLEDLILCYYKIDVSDNLPARRVRTQARFLRKTITALVVILAGASILMLFDKVRQVGTGILTSAGVLGVVVGLAAQRTIANLLVGLQIAFTQPMRIDDVVIIENEWGRIEEINSTYAVVKLWDLRRLIVPLTYFTEKPFQNWTRTSAEILATVFIYTDYTIPVGTLREELQGILRNSKLWDGKVCVLQVTNATESTVELRALMSARDASTAWDLRCEVREGLITFIQRKFPDSLPRTRAEIISETSEKQGPAIQAREKRSDVVLFHDGA